MLNLLPSKELFDEAVHKEFRIISKFFDHDEALLFKERFDEIRSKIFVTFDATAKELLDVAELIKHHCD